MSCDSNLLWSALPMRREQTCLAMKRAKVKAYDSHDRAREKSKKPTLRVPSMALPNKRRARTMLLLHNAQHNDLDILENLKEFIKSGQHEFYRSEPRPSALASLYLSVSWLVHLPAHWCSFDPGREAQQAVSTRQDQPAPAQS